jgi:cytochrome c5
MIMNSKPLLLTVAVTVLAFSSATPGRTQAAAQDKSAAAQHPASKTATGTQNPPPHETEGERIFAQNCSRCHNAPDGFSSRISGTVLRHMQVRASLSKHGEEELMRFFNP